MKRRRKGETDRVVRETEQRRAQVDREARRLKQATNTAVATYELRKV